MKKRICTLGALMLFFGINAFAMVLPLPEDTIAYNNLFNNRQWVQYDSQGYLHITYTGQQGTAGETREIYYVTNKTGELITTQVTNNTTDDNYSVFAIDADDVIHMVYLERGTDNMFQLIYRNTSGGDFSDPVTITSGTNKAPAFIAIGDDNIVHFVFNTYISGSPDHAYYKTYNLNTQSLSAEVLLSASDSGSEHDVRVVTDSNNKAHIIHRSGSAWGGPLKYYNNTSGTMQEYPIPVTVNTEYPAMVIDPEDGLHIIYREASSKQIFYISGDISGNFSSPVPATPSGIGSPSYYRTISLDNQGRLYFTYQNSVSSGPVGFFLVHGKNGVFVDPITVWNDPQGAYLLRNTSSVAARGDGDIAVLYAPSASRDGFIVSDIFMKSGNVFEDPQPLIEVSPLSMDFGMAELDSYNELPLTISNTGMAILNFSLAFNNENFYSPTDGPVSVEPGESIQIPVVFQPQATGEHSGQLTISSNAANEPEVVVELTGNVQETFYITFVIKDQDQNEVTNGVITLDGQQNQEGDYVFPHMLPGDYSFVVEAEGFFDYQGELSLVDQDMEVVVNLQTDDTYTDYIALPEIKVFPNPANQQLTISSDNLINEISITDITGRIVHKIHCDDYRTSFATNHLDAGFYILIVNTNQGTHLQKLQIIR